MITGGEKWAVQRPPVYQHLLLVAERQFWRRVQTDEAPRLFGVESPKPRLGAIRLGDISSSNSWAEFAATYRWTRSAYEKHEADRADLEKLVLEDAKHAAGRGLRAKSGAISPMHRSSETIRAITTAPAKAQIELTNPKKR